MSAYGPPDPLPGLHPALVPAAAPPAQGPRATNLDRVPEIVPVAKPGSLESVADELANWIVEQGDAVAAALLDSGVAPFAAPLSAQESARYYAELLYTPDGLPNAAAWQAEYQRTGAPGLRESVEGAVRYRLANGLPVLGPPQVLPAPQEARP